MVIQSQAVAEGSLILRCVFLVQKVRLENYLFKIEWAFQDDRVPRDLLALRNQGRIILQWNDPPDSLKVIARLSVRYYDAV